MRERNRRSVLGGASLGVFAALVSKSAAASVLPSEFPQIWDVSRVHGDGSTDDWAAFSTFDRSGGGFVIPSSADGNCFYFASNWSPSHWIIIGPEAILKPAPGVTLDFSDAPLTILNPLYQCFDVSAGGAIVLPKCASVTPQMFGAKADGLTDDTIGCQAALNSLNGGGECCFRGNYLVSAGLQPKSSTTLCGLGIASKITCPSGGWTLMGPTNFGLINIYNCNDIRITGLNLLGTKSAAQTTTPKLIYLDTATGVMIDHNRLENSAWEGIWPGGGLSSDIIIEANEIDGVGQPNNFVGLPAIQGNFTSAVIANNRITNCGIGIGVNALGISIMGNYIKNFANVGIGIGDGGESGSTSIVGNVLEFSDHKAVARTGIMAGSGSGARHILNVVGNVVRISGGSSSVSARAYLAVGAGHGNWVGNTAEINVHGIGFEFHGSTSGEECSVSDNAVLVTNEGAPCSGFVGLANGPGKTLTLKSKNNSVVGLTRENGSFAYDYNVNAGGALNAIMAGDTQSQGYVRCGAFYYSSGQTDNIPIYLSSSPSAFSSFQQLLNVAGAGLTIDGIAFARIGTPPNGTIYFVTDGRSGSNPLSGGGSGCLAIMQGGAWKAIS